MYKDKFVYGDATLYLGDCMEVMNDLDKVDAVVTDPPYGIKADKNMSKQSGQKYGKAATKKAHYKKSEWDNEPCSPEKLEAMQYISTYQIIFGGNYFDLPTTSCWLIWDKENGDNNFADCEMAWTNLNKAIRLKKHMWNGMLRKGQEARWGHPTQKPLEVMKWCISHLPNDTETILDPFMGSGTTGVAALAMDKKFIGIELDEDYFKIACERIKAEADQFKLF